MKKIFTLLVLGFISLGMMAEKQISGLVLDVKDEPVIGASVMVKGTTIGTIPVGGIGETDEISLPEGSTIEYNYWYY